MSKALVLESLAKHLVPSPDVSAVEDALAGLVRKYQGSDFAFGLYVLGGGYQFLTKPAYHALIQSRIKHESKHKLGVASYEVLAIIAYRQPVTKSTIEEIRGVSCTYVLQKLLDKQLIAIQGKSEQLGRPLLYKTTESFLHLFGLSALSALPSIKDYESQALESSDSRSETKA